MAFEINEEDILCHVAALHHGFETEIRFTDVGQPKKERFIWQGDNKILQVIKKYNPTKNAYVGINERWHHGSKIVDVKSMNGTYFDYEGKDHAINGKNASLALAEENRAELRQAGLRPGLGDTGRGYHNFIGLDKPIPIDCPEEDGNISGLQARDYCKRIKTWAGNQKNEEAKNDKVVHNLALVEKIVGSYSHSAKQVTFWLEKPKPTSTENFLAWLEKMPKEAVSEAEENPNINAGEYLPNECGFARYALTHCLPRNDEKVRYHYVSPSISALTRHLKNKDEVRKAWGEMQDPTGHYIGALAGWDKLNTKFNCTALRHYAEVSGLGNICEKCIEELI